MGGFKKGKGAGFQAFVSFCRSSVSARVSYGIALLLLWPIKGGPIPWRGQHAASATANPSIRPFHPPKPSSASTYTLPSSSSSSLWPTTLLPVGRSLGPSKVLRLVSYLEGNIVRGLPGPVNRLPTLWDVEPRGNDWPPRIPRHLLTRCTNIYTERFLGQPSVCRGDKGYVLWLRFCLIVRWSGWIFRGGNICVWCVFLETVYCSCIVRVVFFFFFALSRKFGENFINNVTVWSTGRWGRLY